MENFEIDPNLKEEINKEGWEKENKESGAAVIIGKKEEAEKIRERLETGGAAANVETYIRIHKEIALPKEEVKPELSAEEGKAFIEGNSLYFCDKDGNIARVLIDPKKIASLESSPANGVYYKLLQELENLGFDIPKGEKVDDKFLTWKYDVTIAILNYQKKLAEFQKARQKEEFDF